MMHLCKSRNKTQSPLSTLTLNFQTIHSILTKYSYSKIKKKHLFVYAPSTMQDIILCFTSKISFQIHLVFKGRVCPEYAYQHRKWLYFIKFSCTFPAEACSKANRSIFVIHCSPFCCCSVEGSYFCNYSEANLSI